MSKWERNYTLGVFYDSLITYIILYSINVFFKKKKITYKAKTRSRLGHGCARKCLLCKIEKQFVSSKKEVKLANPLPMQKIFALDARKGLPLIAVTMGLFSYTYNICTRYYILYTLGRMPTSVNFKILFKKYPKRYGYFLSICIWYNFRYDFSKKSIRFNTDMISIFSSCNIFIS